MNHPVYAYSVFDQVDDFYILINTNIEDTVVQGSRNNLSYLVQTILSHRLLTEM